MKPAEEKLADDMDHLAALMQRYARVLRGTEQDLTGRGIQQIIEDNIERALNKKLISCEFYEELARKK